MKKIDNKGSTFVLVIIALAMVTIFTSTIFMQINSQIRNNQNSLTSIDAKYASEAGIEYTISKLIEQIESKVNNYSQSSTMSLSNFSNSKDDNFAVVKNELIKAYDKLQIINSDYGVLDDASKSLYNIISSNYNSIQDIQSDIYNFKYKLIWDTAYEEDSIKSSIKDTVYSVLSDVSDSLIKIYSSDEIHRNHEPLYIETIKNEWNDDIYVNQNDIDNKFIGSYYDDTKNDSYQLNSIQNYMTGLVTTNVTSLKNNVSHYELQNKIITLGNLLTGEDSFKNYLITVINEFHSIKYLSGSPQTVYDKLNEGKSKICELIDISINNYANKIENYIYELWIEEFNKYNELNNQNYTMIRDILTKLENIKINLIELKCKLGYTPIDIEGEITLPKEPNNSDTSIPPTNAGDTSGIYIELPSYTYSFGDSYEYSVEAIDRTQIIISYSENQIQSVDDISVDIISTGSNKGKNYKIKSQVVFKTQKTNGKFQTNYTIKTHDKI